MPLVTNISILCIINELIVVQDNGVGISETKLATILQPIARGT